MKPPHLDKVRRLITLAYMACADRHYPGLAWALARCAAHALAEGDLRAAAKKARAACHAARRAGPRKYKRSEKRGTEFLSGPPR